MKVEDDELLGLAVDGRRRRRRLILNVAVDIAHHLDDSNKPVFKEGTFSSCIHHQIRTFYEMILADPIHLVQSIRSSPNTSVNQSIAKRSHLQISQHFRSI
ncbi:unnamed protein product [Anisakis simplex]|uniref:GRAS domain-containing protein n=1 Tax=Anisakis simplex TaxID=6269 RepID=A0A0M3JW71_ANISI|nr:unnamed protein product [Anisakis simplex]